jgi:hypothetical protein
VNEDLERIVQYIRENRDTYTHEAIIRQLLVAGYSITQIEKALAAAGASPEEISQAWQVVERGTGTKAVVGDTESGALTRQEMADIYEHPKPSVTSSRSFWATLAGFILVSVVMLALLNITPSSLGLIGGLFLNEQACSVFIAMQIIALVVGLFLREGNRPVSQGLLIGLLIVDIVFPVLVFVVLLSNA